MMMMMLMSSGLRNILPITTAKVPIVKFEHRSSSLEGDISLYNTLAQHNTRMLATYALLDPRVQILGYTLKVFAKVCDIGDASRGSLSSYGYILMLLYFLQQRQPPVAPVLQQLYDGAEEGKPPPLVSVDGWNAYFFSDIKQLKSRWPHFGENRESVGELWLGLLRFYTEEFDFQDRVISVRQRETLSSFEKQWTSKYISIEGETETQRHTETHRDTERHTETHRGVRLPRQSDLRETTGDTQLLREAVDIQIHLHRG
ncbi:terminal uridylyltransferase 4-like [Lampetra planeri]